MKIQPLVEVQGDSQAGLSCDLAPGILVGIATGWAGDLYQNKGLLVSRQSHQCHPERLLSFPSPKWDEETQLKCLFSPPRGNPDFGGCSVEAFEEAAMQEGSFSLVLSFGGFLFPPLTCPSPAVNSQQSPAIV